jgi:hypothetical protein
VAEPAQQSVNVFVSYRRHDSPGHAGRLQDALLRQLGPDRVFYDVTAIAGGVDFKRAIKDAVGRADVIILVIGPRWPRRLVDRLLSRPDWVRFETECALAARKPILPILVGGTGMPLLPPWLDSVSTINAPSLRDESWEGDVERLLTTLPEIARREVAATEPAPRHRAIRAPLLAALAVVVLAVAAGLVFWNATRSNDQPPPSDTARDVGGVTEAKPPVKPELPNHPPGAGSIEVDQFNGVGLASATTFTLKAKGITDPDGDELRYRWDFGDGSPSPPSSPTVTKIYDRVSGFVVRLFVTDGRSPEILAGQTNISTRDVSGMWNLNVVRDPGAPYAIPTSYQVTLLQQGNQLSGRILPAGSTRSTLLSGSVEHPLRVRFGSESAWWNDDSDAYFDLELSDGFLMVQMRNRTPNKCGLGIPCKSAFMVKQ